MHRTPAGGIEQRGSVAAVHRTDGVVGVLPRRARENGPAGFDLDEIEVERYENARFASGGYQRAHLRQAVETSSARLMCLPPGSDTDVFATIGPAAGELL